MGRFCETCKSLKKMVNSVWICPRCSLNSSEQNRKIKRGKKTRDIIIPKKDDEKQNYSTFEYNKKDYLFFEKWGDLKEAGFDLEDYIGVVCSKINSGKSKDEQKKFFCVELKYFYENNQEMVPIKCESIESIINCSRSTCGYYCLFYPENIEEFSTKLGNYKKKLLKQEQMKKYKRKTIPDFS